MADPADTWDTLLSWSIVELVDFARANRLNLRGDSETMRTRIWHCMLFADNTAAMESALETASGTTVSTDSTVRDVIMPDSISRVPYVPRLSPLIELSPSRPVRPRSPVQTPTIASTPTLVVTSVVTTVAATLATSTVASVFSTDTVSTPYEVWSQFALPAPVPLPRRYSLPGSYSAPGAASPYATVHPNYTVPTVYTESIDLGRGWTGPAASTSFPGEHYPLSRAGNVDGIAPLFINTAPQEEIRGADATAWRNSTLVTSRDFALREGPEDISRLPTQPADYPREVRQPLLSDHPRVRETGPQPPVELPQVTQPRSVRATPSRMPPFEPYYSYYAPEQLDQAYATEIPVRNTAPRAMHPSPVPRRRSQDCTMPQGGECSHQCNPPPPIQVPSPCRNALAVARDWNLKYSGLPSESVEEFLTSLDERRRTVTLTDGEVLNVMSSILKGGALQWYRVMRRDFTSFGHLCEALRARYGGESFQRALKRQLRARVQQEGEPVADYLICMRRLWDQLDQQVSLQDQIDQAIDNMIPEVGNRLVHKGITSFNELMKQAVRKESSQGIGKSRGMGFRNRIAMPELEYHPAGGSSTKQPLAAMNLPIEEGPRPAPRPKKEEVHGNKREEIVAKRPTRSYAAVTAATSPPGRYTRPINTVAKTEHRVAPKTSDAWRSSGRGPWRNNREVVSSPPRRYQDHRPRSVSPREDRRIECWLCREKGHRMFECPYLDRADCLICRERDHKAIDCPRRRRGNGRGERK